MMIILIRVHRKKKFNANMIIFFIEIWGQELRLFVCLFQWTPSFKEGGEYPLGWDLAHILRPHRPHYPEVGWLSFLCNSLGIRILPGTQQIGNWSALYWTECLSHRLHSKEVHSSPLYGAKLTPGSGLVQMLAADWMSGYQATVLKISSNTTIPESWITDPAMESWYHLVL